MHIQVKADIAKDVPRTFQHHVLVTVQHAHTHTHTHACMHIQVKADIAKDVPRTFPEHVLFKGNTLLVRSLSRVLEAYARRNPNTGYCQVYTVCICVCVCVCVRVARR